MADSVPATSAAGLLGQPSDEVDRNNQRFLQTKLPGSSRQSEEALAGLAQNLARWIRDQNQVLLGQMADRVTGSQRSFFEGVNAVPPASASSTEALAAVQQLVRLYQYLSYVASMDTALSAADDRQRAGGGALAWQTGRHVSREDFQGHRSADRITGSLRDSAALQRAPWSGLTPGPEPSP